MEILKENYGLYKVLECIIKKVLKRLKNELSLIFGNFWENLAYFVDLSNVTLFDYLNFEEKA